MITTDNSDTSFDEDMIYMRMLVDRIFRTATDRHLDLAHLGPRAGLHVRGGEVVESRVGTVSSIAYKKQLLQAVARDSQGRFTKRDESE